MSRQNGGRKPRPCLIFGAKQVPGGLVKEALAQLGGENPLVVAADAGWRQALAAGLAPALVVGDFDTAPPPDEAGWHRLAPGQPLPQVLALPAEKDDTDLQAAAREALARGAEQVGLLGVLGGRLDHSLASLATLCFLRQSGAQAFLLDEAARAFCVLPGETLRLPRRENVYLSVFPAQGRAAGVDESGVKYPLKDATLLAGYPLGISNEFAAQTAEISCREGGLFVLMVPKDDL